MTHPNKKKGNNYENRFLKRMKRQGATDCIRHYGSIGITDVEWTDKDGKRHEAQLKFSSVKKPTIPISEMDELSNYAIKSKNKVWLILKQAYKKEEWIALN